MEDLLELIEVARHLRKVHENDDDPKSYNLALVDVIMYRYNLPLQYRKMLVDIVEGK